MSIPKDVGARTQNLFGGFNRLEYVTGGVRGSGRVDAFLPFLYIFLDEIFLAVDRGVKLAVHRSQHGRVHAPNALARETL